MTVWSLKAVSFGFMACSFVVWTDWLSASVSPKLSFMYEEGETSFPEVCHEEIILPQLLKGNRSG